MNLLKLLSLIAFIIVSINSCVTKNTTVNNIGDILNDNNLGRVFTVQGQVLDFALDNAKRGVVKIQDNTGTIDLYGAGNGLYGPFGNIYDGPKFYMEKATGTLSKGLGGDPNAYYLDIKSPDDIKVKELLNQN